MTVAMASTRNELARRPPRLLKSSLVARRIGTQILRGQIAPGALIHGEVEASRLMQISRTAYREAVLMLVAKGMIECRPRLGTRVARREKWQLLDREVISWLVNCGAEKKYRSALREFLALIAPEAAFLAAGRRSTAQLEQLRLRVSISSSLLTRTDERAQSFREFLVVLGRTSGNPYINEIIERVVLAGGATSTPGGAAIGRLDALLKATEDRDQFGAQRQMTMILAEM